MSTKTILITGASSGFGRATAKLLAEQGNNKLILVARRLEKLEELKAELKTDVHIAAVDVRDRSQVEKLFTTLPDGFKDLDVLVNNAGLSRGMEPAYENDLDDWDEMVDTNIKGLMY
jgi:3-hydroxy acid dehydrogenase/malonic semialdehyde reductase